MKNTYKSSNGMRDEKSGGKKEREGTPDPPLPRPPLSPPSDARALGLALLRSRSKPLAPTRTRDWAAAPIPSPRLVAARVRPRKQTYNPRAMPYAFREDRVPVAPWELFGPRRAVRGCLLPGPAAERAARGGRLTGPMKAHTILLALLVALSAAFVLGQEPTAEPSGSPSQSAQPSESPTAGPSLPPSVPPPPAKQDDASAGKLFGSIFGVFAALGLCYCAYRHASSSDRYESVDEPRDVQGLQMRKMPIA